jgi:Ca2+-binding RTX toxin-like protein
MAVINIASGTTASRSAHEVQLAVDANDVFTGVTGGAVETLAIQLLADEPFLLAGKTANFANVALKITGSAGNDTYTGTDLAETVSGLAGNDSLSGNGGNDTLDGGAGNDTLDGGTGNDKMTGGAGNDTFVVDSTTDSVIELANGGTDLVQSSISLTLGTNVENLTLTGINAINGTGNAQANRMTGNSASNVLTGGAGNDVLMAGAGDDTLDGGIGNDVMFGGTGNDTYVVDATADKITEMSGEGTDTVKSSISYKLGSNLENLTLTGTAAINGTGNSLNNLITGNAKANTLTGDAGADTLDGGLGNDTLVGGTGDDSYFLDNSGDRVTELEDDGTDTINAGFSFVLGDNLENLTLTGTANIDGDGNDADNILIGNVGNNVLDGGAGDDNLNGGAGDDILLGGDGDDTLTGGAGSDVLSGGDGDNTYFADADDIVIGGAGLDLVSSNESITLGDGIDNLTLTGTDNVSGTGNDLDNVIIGNAGDNTLSGGAGSNDLSGGAGDDTFIAGEGDDVMNGDAGSDTFVISNEFDVGVSIDGGTDNLTTGDQLVNVVFSTGTTKSTAASTLGAATVLDTIQFTESGDFTNLEFANVEQVKLASGVNVTLSADAVSEAFDSLGLSADVNPSAISPGVHFYGVAGGDEETVTILGDYNTAFTFTPAATVVGATPVVYTRADFQLDDATIGDLFHDVNLVTDMQTGSDALLAAAPGLVYAREDGSNSNETILGSEGVDNADGRLGDDTIFGHGGNDLLKGQGGADLVDGGDGNDIMLIGGFETGVLGAYGKADDGHAEWVEGDVITGGAGTDTLRITVGANAADHTIVLNDDNFIGMERVEVGATVGRLNVENSDLQLLHDHFFMNAGQTVATTTTVFTPSSPLTGGSVVKDMNLVVVDASGITDADEDSTTGGLTFVGNGNIQTFIGTANDDTFIGNGGNDVLTGGLGDDTFQFGKVHTQMVTGAATTVQTYADVATNLTGIDTINGFASGSDHVALDNDFFTAFTATGAIDAGNFVSGAGAVAADADDFLVFDTDTGALYYDADGNGLGAAVQFATLAGAVALADTDFSII